MIKIIKNYDITTIQSSIQELLEKASRDESIRIIAVNAVAGKPDHITAIYDFMRQYSAYVEDPVDKELLISPSVLARDYNQGKLIAGDCDDLAIFTTSLYRAIGLESRVVLTDTQNDGFSHAYCIVKSESGAWINVDLASSYPLGWEPKYYQKVIV